MSEREEKNPIMGNEKVKSGDIDTSAPEELHEIKKQSKVSKQKKVEKHEEYDHGPVNCLRDEKIVVRYIMRPNTNITNPRHVLFGGLAENAKITLVTPILSSTGNYVNVLTKNEKEFLEEFMGLEVNALNIYNKKNNFWDTQKVVLGKADTILDLSDPNDYIKYKILLANKDIIAPSRDKYESTPKATYRFYLTSDTSERSHKAMKTSATMEAYMEFGKIMSNPRKMRTILKLLTNRATSSTSDIEELKSMVSDELVSNPKDFLHVVKDELFEEKNLIFTAVEAKIISFRGNQYYLVKDGTPLCDNNQEPTLGTAAKFLASTAHNDTLVYIQGQLNKK